MSCKLPPVVFIHTPGGAQGHSQFIIMHMNEAEIYGQLSCLESISVKYK